MKKVLFVLVAVAAFCCSAWGQAPAASDLVKTFQKCTATDPTPMTDLLDSFGYAYRFQVAGEDYTRYVYSKNCQVVHEEHSNGVEFSPDRETATASIIVITATGDEMNSISVQIYSKAGFNTWTRQLKAMGYTLSDSGKGNRGQDWSYEAVGKPDVSIWNDYSTLYDLYIGFRR